MAPHSSAVIPIGSESLHTPSIQQAPIGPRVVLVLVLVVLVLVEVLVLLEVLVLVLLVLVLLVLVEVLVVGAAVVDVAQVPPTFPDSQSQAPPGYATLGVHDVTVRQLHGDAQGPYPGSNTQTPPVQVMKQVDAQGCSVVLVLVDVVLVDVLGGLVVVVPSHPDHVTWHASVGASLGGLHRHGAHRFSRISQPVPLDFHLHFSHGAGVVVLVVVGLQICAQVIGPGDGAAVVATSDGKPQEVTAEAVHELPALDGGAHPQPLLPAQELDFNLHPPADSNHK